MTTTPVNPFALDPTPPLAIDTPPTSAPMPTQAAPAFVAPAQSAPIAPPVAMPSGDPFSGPAPQAPRGPRLRDIYGRLVLVLPIKVEQNLPNRLQPGTFQDRMTADVIVLDGGPIAYGGKPEAFPSVPHDKTATVPHRTARQFISSVGLISQCRDALAKRLRGEPGMVLGRLTTGKPPEDGSNPPWLLSPYTEQDAAIARAYLASVDPFA